MNERKDQRIALMIEPTLVGQIDTFRFSNRIGSQAQAMRVLIRRGLEAEKIAATGRSLATEPVAAALNNHQETIDAD